ncbi:multiple sugar transport system substrate-binding protein [Saccharothrix carnea]|uniref:Multiple sugar transport system substrate-binding protein n=1 Tax=Saccharothrix carnea TaxID=1280637 RepID=A0A2P8IDH2_SACCR|nr:ABC transporter substrate-binding protein [Saccharothrix carnea]PSL56503.1 multiple sugar transport system substrate-binding protein [Saccharothrix carnea]
MIRVVMVLVMLLSACTSRVEDEAEGGTGSITFVESRDISADGQVTKLVERWNERAGPREQVTFVQMPGSTDDHRAQLTARAQDLERVRNSPDCYDVIGLDNVWTAEFAAAGHVVPLDPEEFGVDRLLPQAVAAARSPGDGRLWAVPWRSDAGLLYYRKDLLAEADVSPPTTWAELRRQAVEIAAPRGLHGYVGQFKRYEGLIVNMAEVIWAHGGDLERPDDARTKAGVQAVADGIDQGWIPRAALDYEENKSLDEFRAGRALFARSWPYAGPVLEAEESRVAGKWGRVALPGPSALGGWNLAVSRCSANQKTAREFIKFVTNDDNQRRTFQRAGFAPTSLALYEEPGLVPIELRESVLEARIRPLSAYYDELTSVMQENLHHALDNPRAVDKSLDDLAAGLAKAVEGRG